MNSFSCWEIPVKKNVEGSKEEKSPLAKRRKIEISKNCWKNRFLKYDGYLARLGCLKRKILKNRTIHTKNRKAKNMNGVR